MQTHPAFERLASGLAEQGVDLLAWRPEYIIRRLRRTALLSGDVFLDRHVDRLLEDARARDTFLNDLSIGVSEFFRDALPFAWLEEVALPELERTTPRPRALSVGCAHGQETWSLAMLLAERFASFEVTGLDRQPDFAAAGRRGVYTEADVFRVTHGRVRRWFSVEADCFVITQALRPHVRFEVHDLSFGALPQSVARASVELILCRNVFIYMAPPLRELLIEAMVEALAPGGWLMLGTADCAPKHPALVPVVPEGRALRKVGS